MIDLTDESIAHADKQDIFTSLPPSETYTIPYPTIPLTIGNYAPPLLPKCFKCTECVYITLNPIEFTNHIQSNIHRETASNAIKCLGCEYVFYSDKSFISHLVFDHCVLEAEIVDFFEYLLTINNRDNEKSDFKSIETFVKLLYHYTDYLYYEKTIGSGDTDDAYTKVDFIDLTSMQHIDNSLLNNAITSTDTAYATNNNKSKIGFKIGIVDIQTLKNGKEPINLLDSNVNGTEAFVNFLASQVSNQSDTNQLTSDTHHTTGNSKITIVNIETLKAGHGHSAGPKDRVDKGIGGQSDVNYFVRKDPPNHTEPSGYQTKGLTIVDISTLQKSLTPPSTQFVESSMTSKVLSDSEVKKTGITTVNIEKLKGTCVSGDNSRNKPVNDVPGPGPGLVPGSTSTFDVSIDSNEPLAEYNKIVLQDQLFNSSRLFDEDSQKDYTSMDLMNAVNCLQYPKSPDSQYPFSVLKSLDSKQHSPNNSTFESQNAENMKYLMSPVFTYDIIDNFRNDINPIVPTAALKDISNCSNPFEIPECLVNTFPHLPPFFPAPELSCDESKLKEDCTMNVPEIPELSETDLPPILDMTTSNKNASVSDMSDINSVISSLTDTKIGDQIFKVIEKSVNNDVIMDEIAVDLTGVIHVSSEVFNSVQTQVSSGNNNNMTSQCYSVSTMDCDVASVNAVSSVNTVTEIVPIEDDTNNKTQKNVQNRASKLEKPLKPIKCPLKHCKIQMKQNDTLVYHLKCHSPTLQFVCPECQRSLNSWSTTADHLWREHKLDLELFACDQCDFKCYSAAKLEKLHKLTHGSVKAYKCDMCVKAFKNIKQMRNHKALHNVKNDKFVCEVCHAEFMNKRVYRGHVNGCHGNAVFKCSVCEFSTYTRARLVVHERRHSGERPYKCVTCDFCTTDHNSLRRHNLTHTAEKKYKCKLCNFECIQSRSYINHLIKSHPLESKDLIFFCNMCNFQSVNKANYRLHIVRHVNDAGGNAQKV